MWLSSDRTGFPLIDAPDVGAKVQLLPVTKLQFERFVAESSQYTDTWYQGLLSANPRMSDRDFRAAEREQLFVTGVLPDEALAFARWMGLEYDLPNVDEWRDIYHALSADPVMYQHMEWHLSQLPDASARCILQQLIDCLQPRSMLDLSLMRGGLVEWVHRDGEWVGLGAPRPEFWSHLWDPLTDEVRPSRPGERLRHFGFRLLKRG